MGTRDQIENLRNRARETDSADALLSFSDRLDLLASDYSDRRHQKLLGSLVRIAEGFDGRLADALDNRSVAEDVVRWIHREYDNEETNRDYRIAVRLFGRHVTPGDEVPESVDWISSTYSRTHDPTPDPREMFHWEEIQEILEATQNTRDAAAVALGFDAGLRGGEFAALSVGDVSDHKHGLQVTVEGKKGRRTVTLIPSVPHVQRWLADHPRADDSDAPLWCTLQSGEELSHVMLLKMLKEPAKRAGIDKNVTVTILRKSSAAHLASKGMSQAHLEDHHGWVRGSKAAARYISVFAEDADRELARVYGKEIPESDDETIAPLECPRCGKETPRERSLCVWCGQALEPGAAERAEALDDILVQEAADSPPEKANEILEYRDRIRDDPEARAEAIERIMGH